MPATSVPHSTEPVAEPAPPAFDAAVRALHEYRLRPEIVFEELPAPQRLAPWAHAVAATVHSSPDDGDEVGTGRLVVLHDPDGLDGWDGCTRYVVFVGCEVEGEIARDPLLPDVAWSWLLDAIAAAGAGAIALSGTVTATSSVRFGEISAMDADEESRRTDDVEIRASWTAADDDAPAEPHIATFTALLAIAAGLPPEGVAPIGGARTRR